MPDLNDTPFRPPQMSGPEPDPLTPDVRGQVRILASMYVGYAMFMILRMIPSSLSAAVRDDPQLLLSNADWGRIVATGTVGAMIGKLVCGWCADRFGGRSTFAAGLLGTAAGIGWFAVGTSRSALMAAFFVALFAKSAGWPAMAAVIRNWFSATQYGRVWGTLATSSRIGTLTASVGFASLLMFTGWRNVMLIGAAGGCLLSFLMFLLVLDAPQLPPSPQLHPQSTADTAHPLEGLRLHDVLKVCFMSRRFLLITTAMMGLTIVWDLLLFIPNYLSDSLGISAASAGITSSAFPLGSLVSVLSGGFLFDRLSRNQMATVLGSLLVAAVAAVMVMALLPQSDLPGQWRWFTASVALFSLGFCVSPAYYIPMSVFSIEFGGPRSGFLIALLDSLAFAASAAFAWFAGGLADSSWTLFFGVTVLITGISALLTFLFLRGESQHEPFRRTPSDAVA